MLRQYQSDSIQAIVESLSKGIRQQLISMATGTGKTQIFSHLPSILKPYIAGKFLVLAHREELIDQAIDKMRKANPDLKVDKEMAEHHADPNADVIVASVATLGRENARADDFNWNAIGTVITDEAHHATSASYTNIYNRLGVLDGYDGPARLHVGFTATPNRADGTPLAQVFKKIVFEYGLRKAIEDGWLVAPHGIKVRTNTSLDGVNSSDGDFVAGQLAKAINTPERNQTIVKAWLETAKGRKTIGFTADIKHAQDLAAMFVYYGVKAEALWGDDPERAVKLERLRTGETEVILNCSVLTEGFDEPSVSCVLMARPTKSSVLFTQCVGRATRLFEGKTDCLIIDVVDATTKNSILTVPTLMGLNAKLDLKGRSVLWAVQEMEKAQEQYPHIDFSTLADITQLQTYIESVNLFDFKFPAVVEGNSDLSWFPSPTGGYTLTVPGYEYPTGKKTPWGKPEMAQSTVTIKENLLGKWEIVATIRNEQGKPQRYRGERATVEQAFGAGDNLIMDKCGDALKVIARTSPWHNNPASEKQITALKRLYKGKAIPADLTSGAASRLIGMAKAGKGKA